MEKLVTAELSGVLQSIQSIGVFKNQRYH